MRLGLAYVHGRTHIVFLVTLGFALILCSSVSASSLPTAQQIVRDMDGNKFTFVRNVNGYPGYTTTFRAGSASNPRIADVLSDTRQGFAKFTLAIDYTRDGILSHGAIFKVTYRLYDQGWRLEGEISGTSNEHDWVVLGQSTALSEGRAAAQVAVSSAQDPKALKAFQNCVALGAPKESCTTLYLSGEVQTASAGASPNTTAPAIDATPVLGKWSGRLSGWLPYTAVVEVRAEQGGSVEGTTEYRANVPSEPLQCRAALTLKSVEANEYSFDERVTENFGDCPVAGMVRLITKKDGTLLIKTFRPSDLQKERYKGTLRKVR